MITTKITRADLHKSSSGFLVNLSIESLSACLLAERDTRGSMILLRSLVDRSAAYLLLACLCIICLSISARS